MRSAGTASNSMALHSNITGWCLPVQDTRLMKSAGTVSISVALRSTVVATFGVVLMFVTSPLLTALTLAVLPVLLLTFKVYSNFNKRYTAQQLTASAQASTVAEECFGSIRTVRLWPAARGRAQRPGQPALG